MRPHSATATHHATPTRRMDDRDKFEKWPKVLWPSSWLASLAAHLRHDIRPEINIFCLARYKCFASAVRNFGLRVWEREARDHVGDWRWLASSAYGRQSKVSRFPSLRYSFLIMQRLQKLLFKITQQTGRSELWPAHEGIFQMPTKKFHMTLPAFFHLFLDCPQVAKLSSAVGGLLRMQAMGKGGEWGTIGTLGLLR